MSISSRPLEDWSDDPSRPAGTTKSLLIAGVNYVFCWIPAGEFWMGSVERQERGFDGPLENGVPVHKVRLTRGFWALSTPVTQEMHSTITGRNPSFFKGNDRPVENVSWNEFQSYISALNEVVNPPNGWRFRMPTEAQWEYACRAGTTGERYGEVDEIAWHRNNSGDETHPVGQKKPNEWGLYDTIGNVWEWVQDWADGYSKDDVVDPTGPRKPYPDYKYKIRRGGGAFCCPEFCRAAFRIRNAVDERHKFWGGRIVLLPYSV